MVGILPVYKQVNHGNSTKISNLLQRPHHSCWYFLLGIQEDWVYILGTGMHFPCSDHDYPADIELELLSKKTRIEPGLQHCYLFQTLHHPSPVSLLIQFGWTRTRVSHARIVIFLSTIEENRTRAAALWFLNRTSISMGPTVSLLVPVATAVAGVLFNIRSKPASNNPMHNDIEAANRLQQEQEEHDRAAQAAREEAERVGREAEMNAQRAREAQATMEAAQAEAERIRGGAEECIQA
ncbi:hypothetical protein B0H10DRAFT_1955888 [Mycena sp. CBHHK59/15]|nr:hypothetical protein B0H10DRAFT_1955888 [Mycena sp. CBHHK59/15]